MKYLLLFIMTMMSISVYAAPDRFEVMKLLKWRVIDVLEQNLHSGKLQHSEKEIIEYTVYRMKSSLGQFTDKSYFEDLYNQTYHLIKIKDFLQDRAEKNKIDDLITLYQNLLRDLYKE